MNTHILTREEILGLGTATVKKEILGLGTVTFRSDVTIGMMMNAHDLAEKAEAHEQADTFTNFLLSCLFIEPQKTPQDMANLPEAMLKDVIQICIDIAGIRERFESIGTDAPIRERFYEAFIADEQERFKEVATSFSHILDTAKSITTPFNDVVQKMAALGLRISIPKIPNKLLNNFVTLHNTTLGFTQAINQAYNEPLQEMVQKIAQIYLPEPLFTNALITSGLNSPILHSPTYVLPDLQPIRPEDPKPSNEDLTRQRLVGDYDILSQLEQSLRDVIEVKLRELHSEHWWKQGIPPDVGQGCEDRKNKKEKPTDALYHPIYYAYIDDYRKIIMRRDNWRQAFSQIFGNQTELEACFIWVGNVRDPIAHIRPISDEDHFMFVAGARWIQTRIKQQADKNDH